MRQRALWRVLPYLRPHRAKVVFIAVTAIVSIGCQLAIPLVVKAAIDGPITDGDKSGLLPLFALAIGLALVEVSLTHRRRIYLAVVATDVETRLRDDFYEHLQRLEVGFHDRWQSGQLLSRAQLRHLDDPPVHRVRVDLPVGHRGRGGRDLRACSSSCTCRSRC